MRLTTWLRNLTSPCASGNRRPTGNCLAGTFRPHLEQLECRDVLSATLVGDINPGPNSSGSSNLADVNGTVFFAADDGVHGTELWKTDGTATGTILVKDIYHGDRISGPSNLTNVNGTLYFIADDGVHGRELWKSDGTEAGTVLVKDLYPGATASYPTNLVNLNGTLLFGANGGSNGLGIWKSDGTEEGTVLLKNAFPTPSTELTIRQSVINDTLFFSSFDSQHGIELWKSNGTPEGTVLVKDLFPGGISSSPEGLTNVNGTLYFVALNSAFQRALWKSDGTAAGTVVIEEHNYTSATTLTDVNGTLFFAAGFYSRLFKSDGTTTGTVLVSAGVSGARNLTNVNGTLFFTTPGAGFGSEYLWKSDGTEAGTVRILDTPLLPYGPSAPFNSGSLVNVNGRLFLSANGDGGSIDPLTSRGTELWTSDGTAAGTFMVQDILPGADGSTPTGLTVSNGSLFFFAYDGVHGRELWRVSQIVQDDAATTRDGAPVTIDILSNDDLGIGSFTGISTPPHGTIVVNADGSVTYTPNRGFSGVETFTYTVRNALGDIDTATVTVTVIKTVQIDIKPGSTTNAINLNNDGTITVALFSAADFDAATVDVGSVRFAGGAAILSSLEDVNHDGRLDLVLHFRIAYTNLREMYAQLLFTDAADGTLDMTRQKTTLLLSGGTTNGGLWEGLDAATLFMTGQELDSLLNALALK